MEHQVKPGQVWASKATGTQWEVLDGMEVEAGAGRVWWPLQRVDAAGQKTLPEWMLLEDYVLVKEAP